MGGKVVFSARKIYQTACQAPEFMITIAFMAAFALVGSLIYRLTGVQPPQPVPPYPTPGPIHSIVSPSPISSTIPPPKPFTPGTCLTGNFNSPSPKVRKVSCLSGNAEERVVDVMPGATDPSACEGVDSATLGYEQQEEIEEEENGEVVSEIPGPVIVYCLVAVGQ